MAKKPHHIAGSVDAEEQLLELLLLMLERDPDAVTKINNAVETAVELSGFSLPQSIH